MLKKVYEAGKFIPGISGVRKPANLFGKASHDAAGNIKDVKTYAMQEKTHPCCGGANVETHTLTAKTDPLRGGRGFLNSLIGK